MKDRNERVVHLHLAAQAEARAAAQQQARQQLSESATVLAYRAGLDFGRKLEWQAARNWWFTVGLCFGTAAGAAAAAACWALLGIQPVL